MFHFVKVNNKNTFIWENNEPHVLKTYLKEHDTNEFHFYLKFQCDKTHKNVVVRQLKKCLKRS